MTAIHYNAPSDFSSQVEKKIKNLILTQDHGQSKTFSTKPINFISPRALPV